MKRPRNTPVEPPHLSQEDLHRIMGKNPPWPLPTRCADKARNWHLKSKTRIPHAPRPWFYITGPVRDGKGEDGVWDGEGLVQSGCYERPTAQTCRPDEN